MLSSELIVWTSLSRWTKLTAWSKHFNTFLCSWFLWFVKFFLKWILGPNNIQWNFRLEAKHLILKLISWKCCDWKVLNNGMNGLSLINFKCWVIDSGNTNENDYNFLSVFMILTSKSYSFILFLIQSLCAFCGMDNGRNKLDRIVVQIRIGCWKRDFNGRHQRQPWHEWIGAFFIDLLQ